MTTKKITNLWKRNKRSIESEALVVSFSGAFSDFISGLKKFLGSTEKTTEELKAFLKNAKLGLSAPEDILKSLEVKKLNGIFMVGDDIPLNKLEYVMKEGSLKNLYKIAKIEEPILETDAKAFKTIVGSTSEKALDDLAELSLKYKKLFSHLDVTTEDFSKLSKKFQAEAGKMESNLFKYFKEGTVISLVVGSVVVAVDWLLTETEKRKGCFLIRTDGTGTSSCKLINLSCNPYIQGCECANQSYNYYNTTIMAMIISKLSDDAQMKKDCAAAVGILPNKFEESLKLILDTRFDKLDKFVKSLKNPYINQSDICKLIHKDVEDGKIPPCRACDPTANPNSTTFIDSSLLPINYTLKCESNPSILDTLTDVFISTGKNIFDIGNTASGSIKKLGLFAIIILFLVAIIAAIIKLVPKNKNNQWKKVDID